MCVEQKTTYTYTQTHKSTDLRGHYFRHMQGTTFVPHHDTKKKVAGVKFCMLTAQFGL